MIIFVVRLYPAKKPAIIESPAPTEFISFPLEEQYIDGHFCIHQ